MALHQVSTTSGAVIIRLFAGTDDLDFSRYPDKEYQLEWIRYYLGCKAEQNGGSEIDVTDRDVEDFYVKTNKFALVSTFISSHCKHGFHTFLSLY